MDLRVPVESIDLGPVQLHTVVAAWGWQNQVAPVLEFGQLPVEAEAVVE